MGRRKISELPTDPVELRAWVERLKSLFRGWANVSGERGYQDACRYMRQIRQMVDADDPAAPPTEHLIEADGGASSNLEQRG